MERFRGITGELWKYMEINVYNQNAENVGSVEISDKVFGAAMNKDLLYQVVNSEMANKRQVIAHNKGRSEVRGGGVKPWRQKGTGRARHGSIRSPIWKGGGVTHGPLKWESYKKGINKKMAKKALAVALSAKFKDNEVAVVDSINMPRPKTKEMAIIVKNFSKIVSGKGGSYILITPDHSPELVRLSNNIKNIDIIEARNLSPLTVMSHKYAVILKDSLEVLNKRI